ncbi:GL10705 [Drosophila persimilis]|uniref:GL10705 n=1 Tax=Drosophila persimilis TaxID=7234 RepID=B4GAH2_DROPE|nr:GL10705 [Drosophila persimilis]
MSTAKRLVLSLRGRKNSQGNSATSSTRLVSAGTSPGHELEEIAVVSGTGTSSHHFSYGGCIASSDAAASTPRYSTGPMTIWGYLVLHFLWLLRSMSQSSDCKK